MQTAEYPEVSDDFGHWLAGFIDGEGCFEIVRKHYAHGHDSFAIRFHVKLRLDDLAILEQCCAATGTGYVRRAERRGRSVHRPGTQDQAVWTLSTKADCFRLVELLDAHPLRSKKARDYAIWRKAVIVHRQMRRQYGGRPGQLPHDWSAIAALQQRLRAARVYAIE